MGTNSYICAAAPAGSGVNCRKLMNTKTKGYALACVSAVTYGAIPLFAIPLKRTGFSFDTALFYRFLFSSVLLGIILFIRKTDFRLSRREAGALMLPGLMYALSSHFLFVGYDYMPAGVASTILFMYPVFVALIMGAFFKEKLSWVMWGAIALALLGVFVLNGIGGGSGVNPTGMIVVLLSALAYALYMVMVNKSAAKDMDSTKVSFYSMAVCTAFFLLRALSRESFTPGLTFSLGLNLTLFALITTVVSILALVRAIGLIGSTPTAVTGSLEPVTAVIMSVGVFGEPLTSNLVTGIILIIGAVTLTVLSEYVERVAKKLPFVRH